MKSFQEYGKEWLDTLVVAISVAMAFRAYFFEPFNIPTGSMQETLWGYHTVENVKRTAWDAFPLSILKWAWTGEQVVEYRAPATGSVRVLPRRDGFADVAVGPSLPTFKLPTDAARPLAGRFVRAGDTLWQGAVITGDFIFVNRWWWNFFRPEAGEVMIFSTTGLAPIAAGEAWPGERHAGRDGGEYKLQQGTHYIKRMKATPGETYVLEHPVAGFPETVTMGPDEYFACGDNFNNSFDSRYWGPVKASQLRGLGSFVFWPFSGWRKIR